ncbi:NAD(P)/FAD-dependent oxidoreductase [Acidipila sp. EB88]|nr:NAD(P)/FAD-dependent oxidoreductase [Acidipila sp. EB88]
MAHAGFQTEVLEAQATLGGACRTLPLTLPGFRHDFGSAVHPLAAGSPFLRQLPLEKHGLRWLHHEAPLAHPLADETAVVLERSLDSTVKDLGPDGAAWRRMVGPLVEHWDEMVPDLLQPLLRIPRHPLWLARFGLFAAQPARLLADTMFKTERARALFAGLAAHSFLSLDAPFSAAVALVLGAAAHAVGWPIPEGGAGSITGAMASLLADWGGAVELNREVRSLDSLGGRYEAITFFDTTPGQMRRLAGDRFPASYARKLARFRPGPAAFKVDYALSEPIPWTAAGCRRASTVHLGGTLGEIARSERRMLRGERTDDPYVLVAQPTLRDPTRAPADRHVAWAYCHVPHGSQVDAVEAIEAQMERFAPGFRECVLHRSVASPRTLEAGDANLQGGDISGGAMDIVQQLFRPTLRAYRTPDPLLFLCSSSTPPGAGVHGMCGYNAANAALRRW